MLKKLSRLSTLFFLYSSVAHAQVHVYEVHAPDESKPRMVLLPTIHAPVSNRLIADISEQVAIESFDKAFFEHDIFSLLNHVSMPDKVADYLSQPEYQQLVVSKLFAQAEIDLLKKIAHEQKLELNFSQNLHLFDLIRGFKLSYDNLPKAKRLRASKLYDVKLMRVAESKGVAIDFLDSTPSTELFLITFYSVSVFKQRLIDYTRKMGLKSIVTGSFACVGRCILPIIAKKLVRKGVNGRFFTTFYMAMMSQGNSADPILHEMLIKNRNDVWVERLTNSTKKGGIIFAAGGLGHFFDEVGILKRFEKEGFIVKQSVQTKANPCWKAVR